MATCDWVFEHARRTPDAPAVDSPDDRLSYGLLAGRVLGAASTLRRLGVRAGDRVVVALPNVPAAVVVSLAVQHLDAVSVEVSREWTADQLAAVLREVEPSAVALASQDALKFGAVLRAARVTRLVLVRGEPTLGAGSADDRGGGSTVACTTPGGPNDVETVAMTPGGVLEDAATGELPAGPPARDDGAVTLLLYTSGSTGQPRAVMQTMTNIAANTRAIVEVLGLGPKDRAMLILPLPYCYGRSVLQTHLYVGGSVLLYPRFVYPRLVLAAIAAERCTGFAGVPLTYELLARHTEPRPGDMPALRYVTQAGGAMRPATVDWTRAVFRPAELFVMYGQTEATARLAYLPPQRGHEKRGSIGVPIPGVELRVVDDAGADVACRVTGHLVARGANVTPGYHRAPEETASILRDGWLWTGDMAYRDEDGFLFLAGRAKEILKIGGHRGSPAQIEAALEQHPDVMEVVAAGIADPLRGEAAAALAVLRPGARATEQELRRFCSQHLPPYLVPRVVRIVGSMPRGPSGKIQRDRVSRLLARVARSGPRPVARAGSDERKA